MSNFEFKVLDWIQAVDPDPRRVCTSAEIIIIVDDIPVTRLFDNWSRTVTDRARVPLYPLAEWFAANWWRIHAETPFEGGDYPPTDWRLSHDLTAIGGGIIWPRMRFASDDQVIRVSARAVRNAPWEPIRHLNDVQPPRAIPIEAFDRAVDGLINLVLRRMDDFGVSAEPLASIWSDVVAERADLEVRDWRIWEARLGFDAEQAPEHLMNHLAELFQTIGKAATAEVAPLLGAGHEEMLRRLNALVNSPGVDATFPLRSAYRINSEETPWDAGRDSAREVRKELSNPTGPIQNQTLSCLLGMSDISLENKPSIDAPIGLGVFSDNQTAARLHFTKRNLPGMRFQAARFLADSIRAPVEDRWLPLTDRATARQKFQRAFAAELLIPMDEIGPQFAENRTQERIEDLAEHYMVSPIAVRSHLANHGLLDSEAVALIGGREF
jgi:hypothetical protein